MWKQVAKVGFRLADQLAFARTRTGTASLRTRGNFPGVAAALARQTLRWHTTGRGVTMSASKTNGIETATASVGRPPVTHGVALNASTEPAASTVFARTITVTGEASATSSGHGVGQSIAEGVGDSRSVSSARAAGAIVQDASHGQSAQSPTVTYRAPAASAGQVVEGIASAGWTGRRTPAEQVRIVRAFAAPAIAAAEQLCAAIEDKRRNDPADQEALKVLKELHHAIGDLIAHAERGEIGDALWRAYESQKGRLNAALTKAATWTVCAPIAVGLCEFLGWLSGNEPTGEMATAIYVGLIGSDAVMTAKK